MTKHSCSILARCYLKKVRSSQHEDAAPQGAHHTGEERDPGLAQLSGC